LPLDTPDDESTERRAPSLTPHTSERA
jgi:hypothetical protein